MTRKQRHLLTRIIVAAVLFLAGSLLHLPELAEMAVFLVCYVVVGWDIVWKAITNILHGQVFDENFLMTIATIGALILGEHSEGVAVMLFYQVGEWFQSYAVSKSRKSIASLMDIRPDYANIERDGKLVQVDPDEFLHRMEKLQTVQNLLFCIVANGTGIHKYSIRFIKFFIRIIFEKRICRK